MEREEIRLEIKDSPIHGRGVFASGPIRAGATVAVLTGDPKQHSSFPRDLLLMRGFEVSKDTYVVPEETSPAWYFNHSAVPNCSYKIKSRSIGTLREISEGEELTIDYRATTTWEGYVALWRGDRPP